MSNLGTITYTAEIETAKLVSGTSQANKQLDSLESGMKKTDIASKNATKAVGDLSKKMSSIDGSAASKLSKVAGSIADSAKASDDAKDPLTNLVDTMVEGAQSANSFSFSMGALAKAIAGVITVGSIVSEFQKAISVTLEFNATISNLSALTGAVGKDLEVFRQAAIDIGGSTSLSATQAAEAMKLIGSASPELLKSADSLKSVTQQAVILAEAAGSTLPQAADALTGALNQFQLGSDQAGRVINVLAAGAKEGASEINDTVEAMRNSGVVAAQAGLNFEQFNGAIQALAQGQIKGAEAGTGLRNVLTILNTQVNSNLKPSVVGLSQALANLEKAGLDDTQMVKLFGRENITTAKVLLQFRGTMDEVTKSITGTSEAYKQAATNQNNLKGDVANLSSAFETLQISIGDLSDSTLRDLTQQLTSLIASFSSNKDSIAGFFETAGYAALSFAAIITGRVAAGLLGYAKAKYAIVAAELASANAATSAAAAQLALARAENAAATAALAAATAAEAAAVGFTHHAAAVTALAAATVRADAATIALSGAIATSAGLATRASIAFGILGKAVGFLGGPLGVFLLAATAVAFFTRESKAARVEVDALAGSLDKLTFSQLDRAAGEIKDEMAEFTSQLSKSFSEINTLTKRPFETDESFVQRQKDARAALDDINQALSVRRARLEEIANAQKNITTKQQAPAVDPVRPVVASTTSEEGQKGIDALKEQLELAKLTGEAKARLQAIQKLGAAATEQEKAEAASLGAEIYKLENATKTLGETNKKQKTEAEQLAKRAAAEEKRGIEQNIEVYARLGSELAAVGQNARDVAMQQAELSLNDYATPEQIQQVRDMAGALYDLNEAKANKALLGQVDPLAAEQQSFETQIQNLQKLNDAKLLSDQRYLELKGQLETEHAAQLTLLDEQRFAAQSKGNALIISTLNQVQSAATSAFTGLITGASNGEQAVQALAGAILNEAVGAVVAFGVAQLKSLIIGQTVGAAAAGASITAAAAVGTAWAGPAGLVAIATLGGASVPASAALLSTAGIANGIALSGGARQYGGGVAAGGMYRVNETGAPEIFNAANGRQYMMPNQRGEVVSNKDATSGADTAQAPIININNYSQGQASTSSKWSEADRRFIVDVIVGDAQANGRVGKTVNQITGTKRVGS